MAASSADDDVVFKRFIADMKRALVGEDVRAALACARSALDIRHSDKLVRKISKMEDYLEQCEEDDMEHIGEMFYVRTEHAAKLYQYQKEGLLWLWRLHEAGKGGIMGDDMGLGKTVQIVTFLASMMDQLKVRQALIVMPVSLIPNWEKEFEEWAPGIEIYKYHGGTKRQRERELQDIQRRGGVMLTSYGLLVSSAKELGSDVSHYGRSFVWDYMILDEGHKIKNPTKCTKGAHSIPAHHRFILTGTPIQNNLQELWSLFDFAHQGSLLGSAKTFKMEFETPIVRSRARDATAIEKAHGNRMAEMLRKRIEPYFLRRTKAEVLGDEDGGDGAVGGVLRPTRLMRKNDFVVWIHLSDIQIKLYQDFLNLDSVKEVLMTRRSPLVELTVMKKICDHPRLLSSWSKLGLDESFRHLQDDEGFDCVPEADLRAESGKMEFLMILLRNLHSEGHRCLVFSQSRKILDIIQRLLVGANVKLMRIDGQVKQPQERQNMVDRFNRDPSYSVFLLTTMVGGVGLTITAANRVVIYDPSWNPATDSQAVDRAYRIGQTRSVVVYRLITCGSVEEKIYRRQVFKRSFHEQTTEGARNPFRYFSNLELRDMFRLDDPTRSATQVQLERMHSAHRVSDTQLDGHIAELFSFGIFGISDHDLIYTISPEDDLPAGDEERFVGQMASRAEKLVNIECELTERASAAEGKFVKPGALAAAQERAGRDYEAQDDDDAGRQTRRRWRDGTTSTPAVDLRQRALLTGDGTNTGWMTKPTAEGGARPKSNVVEVPTSDDDSVIFPSPIAFHDNRSDDEDDVEVVSETPGNTPIRSPVKGNEAIIVLETDEDEADDAGVGAVGTVTAIKGRSGMGADEPSPSVDASRGADVVAAAAAADDDTADSEFVLSLDSLSAYERSILVADTEYEAIGSGESYGRSASLVDSHAMAEHIHTSLEHPVEEEEDWVSAEEIFPFHSGTPNMDAAKEEALKRHRTSQLHTLVNKLEDEDQSSSDNDQSTSSSSDNDQSTSSSSDNDQSTSSSSDYADDSILNVAGHQARGPSVLSSCSDTE